MKNSTRPESSSICKRFSFIDTLKAAHPSATEQYIRRSPAESLAGESGYGEGGTFKHSLHVDRSQPTEDR